MGREVREAVGTNALAIHHIGSTSVPGLAAKDVIDVQLTVADLVVPIRAELEAAGFTFREGVTHDHCPPGMDVPPHDLEKRYYSRRGEGVPVHLHVRAQGRYNQRYALLCRDYLRATPMAAHAYAEVKRQLARRFPEDPDGYYDIKDPVFDVLMAGAFVWARATDWTPPPGDA